MSYRGIPVAHQVIIVEGYSNMFLRCYLWVVKVYIHSYGLLTDILDYIGCLTLRKIPELASMGVPGGAWCEAEIISSWTSSSISYSHIKPEGNSCLFWCQPCLPHIFLPAHIPYLMYHRPRGGNVDTPLARLHYCSQTFLAAEHAIASAKWYDHDLGLSFATLLFLAQWYAWSSAL